MVAAADDTPFRLPEGFRFGVATAGFQTEGGYNGPGQPANNWKRWEDAGRVEPSGEAVRFWSDAEAHLERAVAAGCDAFRLSVEWARCEPVPGAIDEDAFARYGEILDGCRARGLEPLVSLHHFTHPRWLGEDFWLTPRSPERFAEWAALAVDRLGGRCRQWVTVNEPNVLALASFFLGAFPPGQRLHTGNVVRAYDNLLAAHVLAYDAVKARQPDSVVGVNPYSFSVYELDRLGTDLLLARRHGVDRHGLRRWLVRRRRAWHADVGIPPGGTRLEGAVRRLARGAVPLEQAFPRTVAAVYASPHDCTVDVTQIDYYDPLTSRHLRLPGHRTAGGRAWEPARQLWDDPPDPEGLTRWCRRSHEPGLDVWVVENGMCNRVRAGRSYPRLDGWDRPRYLRENLAAVVAAIDAGTPVGAYYHWTLADNYEWGSYEPRFGLYGIDRERGAAWSDRDAMGHDAAGECRRIIEGLRAGARGVLG